MTPMNHSSYVYTPRSAAVRRRMSVSQRARLGIPEGHVQIYGIHVPEGSAPAIRAAAQKVASKIGREAAVSLVERARGCGWHLTDEREWSLQEEAALRRHHFADMPAKEIAEQFGRTVVSIAAAQARLRLHPAPPGLRHVPIAEVRKLAADHMECELRSRETEAATFLIAPNFIAPTHANIACYTGIPRHRIDQYWSIMRRTGLWDIDGPKDRDRHLREGPEAHLNLVLDALVCLGKIRHKFNAEGEDLWYA